MRPPRRLHQGENGHLAFAADVALVDVLVLLFAADVRFVRFNDFPFAAERSRFLGVMPPRCAMNQAVL